ncbi:hypothetical protein EVAR_56506_1 [Eumeta japonica]|uniref:Uncharacterized protein n=1 Tax=Eumeta variegata TaxID=151549 RepID=A0A4C1XMF6_EUMVA|nr:hypothetical protein EVAR_56506_1 [Eumeta japonica]
MWITYDITNGLGLSSSRLYGDDVTRTLEKKKNNKNRHFGAAPAHCGRVRSGSEFARGLVTYARALLCHANLGRRAPATDNATKEQRNQYVHVDGSASESYNMLFTFAKVKAPHGHIEQTDAAAGFRLGAPKTTMCKEAPRQILAVRLARARRPVLCKRFPFEMS